MNLLLHTCCAPCAIYPLEEAKKDNFRVSGFFYNPNIQPISEYARRKKEVEKYFASRRIRLFAPERKSCDFFDCRDAGAMPPGRCRACWEKRIGETASFAREKGFDAFTTTLLGSPYQDHGIVKTICEDVSRELGINFYYKDFRIGFREAHEFARDKGIYRQNYCGCVFSLVEREEARLFGSSLRAPTKSGRSNPI